MGKHSSHPFLLCFFFTALFVTYFSADLMGRRKALALSYLLSGLLAPDAVDLLRVPEKMRVKKSSHKKSTKKVDLLLWT